MKSVTVTLHNLDSAVIRAEAGDSALWEDIARVLLANRARQAKVAPSKPKKAKKSKSKSTGSQTWAHVTLTDGREFLTSQYLQHTLEATLLAHGARAQRLAQNEDCGCDLDPKKRFDLSTPTVDAKNIYLVSNPEAIEHLRNKCFEARGRRQGWWEFYVAREAVKALDPQACS